MERWLVLLYGVFCTLIGEEDSRKVFDLVGCVLVRQGRGVGDK